MTQTTNPTQPNTNAGAHTDPKAPLTMAEAHEVARQINGSKKGWYAAAEPVHANELTGDYRIVVRQLPQAVLESTQTIRSQQEWQRFHATNLPGVPATMLDGSGNASGVITPGVEQPELGTSPAGV